jgi:signal transduction histidine kinase
MLQRSITSLRETCADLRPAVLDDLGLVAATEWLVRQFRSRTGTPVELQLPQSLSTLPPQLSTDVFRILQESLTNITRHAGATSVQVTLAVEGGTLRLRVEDNGCGPRTQEVQRSRSFGILGMQERALRWQGVLTVGPGDNSTGTRVELEVPTHTVQERTAHDPSTHR